MSFFSPSVQILHAANHFAVITEMRRLMGVKTSLETIMFYTVIWSSVSSRLCELLPAIGPEIVKILGVHEGEDDHVFLGLTLYRPIGSVLKLETICFFSETVVSTDEYTWRQEEHKRFASSTTLALGLTGQSTVGY